MYWNKKKKHHKIKWLKNFTLKLKPKVKYKYRGKDERVGQKNNSQVLPALVKEVYKRWMEKFTDWDLEALGLSRFLTVKPCSKH